MVRQIFHGAAEKETDILLRNPAMLLPIENLLIEHPTRKKPLTILQILGRKNIRHLGTLLLFNPEQLLKIEGMDEGRVSYLAELLAEYGYALGQAESFVKESPIRKRFTDKQVGTIFSIPDDVRAPRTIPLVALIFSIMIKRSDLEGYSQENISKVFQTVYQRAFKDAAEEMLYCRCHETEQRMDDALCNQTLAASMELKDADLATLQRKNRGLEAYPVLVNIPRGKDLFVADLKAIVHQLKFNEALKSAVIGLLRENDNGTGMSPRAAAQNISLER